MNNDKQKTYLGDSVYASTDGYHITLTTENGMGASNTIHLDSHVFSALMQYSRTLERERIKKTIQNFEGVQQYDAELTNWGWGKRYPMSILGVISNDKKGRFDDDTLITTSNVQEIKEIDGQKYAFTLNSVYKLIGEENETRHA